MDISKKIQNLYLEREKIEQKIEELKKLDEDYPGIDVYVDRWNIDRYLLDLKEYPDTKFIIAPSCGCCWDANVFVRFFIEVGEFTIRHTKEYFLGELCYALELTDELKQEIENDGFGKHIEEIESYLNEYYSYDRFDDDY